MASQYVDLPLEGGSAGVSSLNSITGAITLVAGSGITITPSGQDITIAATGSSYTFADSIVNTSGTVTLVNDALTPGNSYYYGTDSGGTKGWYAITPGGVTDVTASSPLASSGGSTPNITITGSSLTEATSSVLTITGGSASQLTATTIQVSQAGSSSSGYLSSTDWNTFNGKQSALTFANSIQNMSGTVNLVGDSTSPGNGYFYGTNFSDVKGFYYTPWRGTVTTAVNLPASGNTTGDVIVTQDTSVLYVWTGSAWTAEDGLAGVTALNTLTGSLTIAPGTGITVTPSGGNTLTVATTVTSGLSEAQVWARVAYGL